MAENQLPSIQGDKFKHRAIPVVIFDTDGNPSSGGGGGGGDASAANQVTGNTRLGDLTEGAPASDTASSGLNGRLQRIAQRITSLIALVPASLGSKSAANSFAVTRSTEDVAAIGGLTEVAPASDTASSGLNGRLQRIAQRLTTLMGTVLSVKKDQQVVQDCTVTSGQSLSGAVDLSVARLVGIATPASIDSATMLSFQSSYDGSTYNNVYDSAGIEKIVTVSASRRVILSPADFYGIRYIKVRLGTAASPVSATADRVLKLVSEA